jgi:hypothetical protein
VSRDVTTRMDWAGGWARGKKVVAEPRSPVSCPPLVPYVCLYLLFVPQLKLADVAMNKLLFRREKGEGSQVVADLDAHRLDEGMFVIPGKRSYENVWAPAEVR